MSSRPSRNAPPTRPSIKRRFSRPDYRPARPTAPPSRIFRRNLARPAFKDRRIRARDVYLRLGLAAGLAVVLGCALLFFETYYSNRVDPHISIDGIPIGGVALSDVPNYLHQHIDARNSQPLVLRVDDRIYQVTSSQFHPQYNTAVAITAAQGEGHSGGFLTRIWNQFNTLLSGQNYPLEGTHDTVAVKKYLGKLAKDIAYDPQAAEVGIDNGQVIITHEPVLGRRLDVAAATRLLNDELNHHSLIDITMPVQFPASPISHEAAQRTVNQAQDLLSQDVFFSSLNKVKAWYLKPSQLLRLLKFRSGFDPHAGWSVIMTIDTKKLAVTMAPIAAAVDHAPLPAYYRFADAANGQPDTAIPTPDSPGLAIDIDKAAQAILVSPANGHVAVIPFTHPHSRFTLDAARALNFDTLEGKAVISLSSSSETRIHNAIAAARRLDNIRLQPGQTLSVTTVISPVARSTGFVRALGGSGLRYDIAGTNGGPTAVASALYEAAYQAGLTIVQRAAYPNISFLNGLPGGDAVIQQRPGGDNLQLVNNTSHQLLIGVVADKNQIKAYVFDSSSVVRRTVISGPIITLNQDGSIDSTISRTVSGDVSAQDSTHTHYTSVN